MTACRLISLIFVLGLSACTSVPPQPDVIQYVGAGSPPSATLRNYAYYAVPDETAPTRSPAGGTNQAPVKAQQSSPQATSPSSATPQALADALEQAAKVEVTQWAVETLAERFCNWNGSVNVGFEQTCSTVSRYAMEPYMTPGVNDMLMLQTAVRTDLGNYFLAHLLSKYAGDTNAWQWIFYASFIDRVHAAGMQNSLKWVKDVPGLQDTCKSVDIAPCAMYVMSLLTDVAPATAADADKVLCEDFSTQLKVEMTSTLWTQISCQKGVKWSDWVKSLSSKFKGSVTDPTLLMASAARFDRRYHPSIAHGIGASYDEAIYADELIDFLSSVEGPGGFLSTPGTSTYLRLIFTISAAAASQNYREIIYRITSSADSEDILSDSVIEGTETYRLLMIAGDIASANGTSDLSTTINSIAGPTGGYMYKTITPGLLTLTGLVGLDYERDQVSGGGISTSVVARGAFAPIGFEISTPCWGTSCGLLASLIDVGNLLSYSNTKSTSGGTISSGPNTTFAQVLSPGLYYVQGFKDSPFVIGIGASRTPRLRVAEISNTGKQDLDAYRVMIFIAIDVTFADLKEYW